MKRILLLVLLMAVSLLGGCAAVSIDSQLYAVSLGIDQTDDGQIMISIQFPTINKGGGGGSQEESESEEGNPGYTLATATGHSLVEALDVLEATVPRKPNMTGVKTIVVSEKLARSSDFSEVLHEMAITCRIYGAAHLVVCQGDAQAFIKAQKIVVGLRLSETISAALTHYQETGYIPQSKAADVYFLSRSIYGDPVAVWAASTDAEEPLPAGQMGASLAGALPRTGENKNQYYGTALLKQGQMVGLLNGAQTQLLNVLLGDLKQFSCMMNDSLVRIRVIAPPIVHVQVDGATPQINVELFLAATGYDKNMDPEELALLLTRQLEGMTAQCQADGVDPFRFAEAAAGQFATVKQWQDYDWHSRFPYAQVVYKLHISKESS